MDDLFDKVYAAISAELETHSYGDESCGTDGVEIAGIYEAARAVIALPEIAALIAEHEKEPTEQAP